MHLCVRTQPLPPVLHVVQVRLYYMTKGLGHELTRVFAENIPSMHVMLCVRYILPIFFPRRGLALPITACASRYSAASMLPRS